ncbi:organic cation transporter protein-like [Amphiura filiformis]|uniref:organic cation transporter protein-like n=1 Tax=Amphiura filiformis TaxID=82378 RepID=UPI003B2183F6
MELDDALVLLGDFGFYQTIIYILICTAGQVPSVWHMLAISFIGAAPDHHCQLPPGRWPNDSIPVVENRQGNVYLEDEVEYSSCKQYINFTSDSNETIPCTEGWWYDDTYYGSTIVTEWNLVCGRTGLVEISQIVFMSGVMVGSLLFGQLSDRFGRRIVWFVSLWSQVFVGVMAAFTQHFATFTVLRFIIGMIEQGVDITSYVMATEMFSPSKRAFAGIMLTNFWASGMMALAGIAYLLRDWRHLQLAISLPSLLTIPLWWLVPESTRWLLSRGRTSEAEEILQKIARYNKVVVPDGGFITETNKDEARFTKASFEGSTDDYQLTEVNDHAKANQDISQPNTYEEKAYNIKHLFRTTHLRRVSLVMIFTWFVNALVYYGLSLNTGSLAGDPYLNFFLSGAVEIPAYIVSTIVVTRFGRRGPLCIFHVFGGVACIVAAFIPESTDSGVDLTPLIVTTAMLGKFGIAGSYAIVFLYASELFPTVIRNLGVGMSSFSSRVGGIAAPFIMYLGNFYIQAPMIIFGVLSAAAGILVLVLPETLNRRQPQTIEDAETMANVGYRDECNSTKTAS